MNDTTLTCEVCKSEDLVMVLDLGLHPLCDDLLSIGSSDVCEEFQIEIALCRHCLTAHQMHPVPKRRLFPSSYHYRSSLTKDVLNGMRDLVDKTKEHYGNLSGKKVVDIGCNDGSLLAYFRDEGAAVFGVEPTAAAQDAVTKGISVANQFFDASVAQQIAAQFGKPDFITFTNVFAHIEDVDSLLTAVKVLMGNHTRLVVENHYLGAVLQKFQFDTFYHEHPRTYSLHSFAEVAKRLECSIEHLEFPSRYGGNIRVFMGPGTRTPNTPHLVKDSLQAEVGFELQFARMRETIVRWQSQREALLQQVRDKDGKIYAKAFPGRAAILIKLLGLTEHDICAVFERPNSKKVSHYVPGTRIPIVSEDTLLQTAPPPRPILNLAWHISAEIHQYMRAMDEGYRCVDIFAPDAYR